MKRIRNLTIILLSFIVMLCLAVGIVLCFPAQESSARAADAPRAGENSLTAQEFATKYPALATGTKYIVGPSSMGPNGSDGAKYKGIEQDGLQYVSYDGMEGNFFEIQDGKLLYCKKPGIFPDDVIVHLILPESVTSIPIYTDQTSAGGDQSDSKFTLSHSFYNVYSLEFATKQALTVGNANANSKAAGRVITESSNIRQITFPCDAGLTIGNYAFNDAHGGSNYGNAGLQSVKIEGKGNVTIGSYAFNDCRGLRVFEANPLQNNSNNRRSTIGAYAFKDCIKLYRAILPGGLTTIDTETFNNDLMLSDAIIPEGVTTINSWAFASCGLIQITLPSTLTTINANAFQNCFRLVEVHNKSTTNVNGINSSGYGTHIQKIFSRNETVASQIVRIKNGLVFGRSSSNAKWHMAGYASHYEMRYENEHTAVLKFPGEFNTGTIGRYTSEYVSSIFVDWFTKSYDYMEYDASAADGIKYVSNNLNEDVNSYDILAQVFRGIWAPYVELSDIVTSIGYEAFTLSHLSSIVLGENITQLNGLTNLGAERGLTVYIKNPLLTISSMQITNVTANAANPVRFIYMSKPTGNFTAPYCDNIQATSVDVNPDAVYTWTYLVNVNYHIDGVDKVFTEQRMHGFSYKYICSERNNFWSINASLNLHNLADDFFGNFACADYASTKWYSGTDYYTEMTLSGVDDLLTSKADDAPSKIDLYTKRVDKTSAQIKVGDKVNKGWTYGEDTWSAPGEGADIKAAISYNSADGNTKDDKVTQINNAGTYSVTFTLAEKWGEWDSEVLVNIKIEQVEIKLNQENYTWSATLNGSNRDINHGPVNITGGNPIIDGNGSENYYLWKASDTYSIGCSYTDNSVNSFISLSVKDEAQSEDTRLVYIVETKAKDNNNYLITGDVRNEITIYLVQAKNTFKNVFNIAGFEYGQEPTLPDTTPEAGTVSFELTWDDKLITNIAAGDLGKVVNQYMPAATYKLTANFTAGEADGISYDSGKKELSFTVSPAAFSASVTTILNDLKGKTFEFELDKNADKKYLFDFSQVSGLENLLNGTTKIYDRGKNDSEWSKADYDSYFGGLNFQYTTSASSTQYENYASGKGLSGRSNNTVYFYVTADNYQPLFNNSTMDARSEYRFGVVIYEVISVPAVASLDWRGEGVTVKPNIYHSDYGVNYNDETYNYTVPGVKNITLTLIDPVICRWSNGENKQSVDVAFTINKVDLDWTMEPSIISWLKGGFNAEVNSITALPSYTVTGMTLEISVDSGTDVYSCAVNSGNTIIYNTDNAVNGSNKLSDLLNELGAGTHTLTVKIGESGSFELNDYFKTIPDSVKVKEVKFEVTRTVNSWKATPSLSPWVYGSAISKLSADPTYKTDTEFTIKFGGVDYKISVNGTTAYDAIDLVNAKYGEISLSTVLEGLGFGSYTLEISCPQTDDYYAMSATVGFSVMKASNGWTTFPNITSWEQGKYSDNFTEGSVTKGTITYYLDETSYATKEALVSALSALETGSYVLKATVTADDNYLAVNDFVIPFAVWNMTTNGGSSGGSSGITISDVISQTFSPDAKFAIDDLEVKGLPAGAKIVYTVTKVGGDIQTPVARAVPAEGTYEYCEYLINHNGVGTYIVTITANGTVNGTVISVQKNVSITVTPADDEWTTSRNEASIIYGTSTGITEFIAGSGSKVSYSLNGTAYTFNDLTINVAKLNVGTYAVTAYTLAGNYAALSGGFTLTVNPASNEITSISVGSDEFTYGTVIRPVAQATHGGNSFTFAYQIKNGNVWENVSTPSDVGEYRVKATVAAFGNYAETTSDFTAQFSIIRANATISNLTMGNFQWNGYDKTTFAQATSNSPAAISYAVYSGTNKLFNLTLDANGLPDDESVAAMNNLVAGSYRLVASTEVSTNFNATSTGADTGNFTVTAASNGWLVTPGIRSWVHYLFDDEVNMPYAAPQYGNITVEIRRESDNELIYSGTMTVTVGSDGEYTYAHTGNTAKLWNAVGGVYVLTVTVSGEQGKYNGLTSTARFDIFTGSTSRPQNYWEEVPSIDSWTSEYQDYTTPAGVPNRWTTVTHEYYEAERTQDGFVSGDTVLATITRTYVGAGSPDKIEVDGTMPQKPGWYKVVYTSEYEDGETVYEADALTYTVYFQILEAENSWIETPSIENWLLNGEASVPTTGSAMYDSDYEITYRPFDDPDATHVEEKPTTAGRYVMIVTAKAKVEGKPSLYCKDIVSEVVFTVSLAVNEWITPPVMENWSEEFSDQEHNPVAEAKAGTVTYYYYDSNHELLKEKPTAAGDYFMVAEVEAEGYEKLSAEVKFTITSAWDESLILVDIVLGIAACAATVVAIIFAKRRKSQC